LNLALDQGTCRIYSITDGAYLGLCRTSTKPADTDVIVTLVTDDVDGCFDTLSARGVEFEKPPQLNPEYRIYHCFFRDPDGHLLEIQRFEDPDWNHRG